MYLRILSLAITAMLVAGACGDDTPSSSEQAKPDSNQSAEEFSFAVVLPGAVGDQGINDLAHAGAMRAIDELGVTGVVVENHGGPGPQEGAFRQALEEDYDLVVGVTMPEHVLMDSAETHPDVLVGSPDLASSGTDDSASLPQNMTAFTINTHESSYLAGVVAGSFTQSRQVGAVGGADIPGVRQFIWGYTQGVLSVCPDCTVDVSYLDFQFADPATGKQAALAQYEAGADIVYQVAGYSGMGVIEAAEETGNFAIGVDANQDDVAPGSVIVSMLKLIDYTTFKVIEGALAGNYEGRSRQANLADGYVALSWDKGSSTFADHGPAEMTAMLPAIRQTVDAARAEIIKGDTEVCNAMDVTEVCDGVASVIREVPLG